MDSVSSYILEHQVNRLINLNLLRYHEPSSAELCQAIRKQFVEVLLELRESVYREVPEIEYAWAEASAPINREESSKPSHLL